MRITLEQLHQNNRILLQQNTVMFGTHYFISPFVEWILYFITWQASGTLFDNVVQINADRVGFRRKAHFTFFITYVL